MNIPTNEAGRLRISRSSYIAELTRLEERIMTARFRAQEERRNRKPTNKSEREKPEKLAALVSKRAEILRCILERDSYILRAWAQTIPARFRGDLYVDGHEKAQKSRALPGI